MFNSIRAMAEDYTNGIDPLYQKMLVPFREQVLQLGRNSTLPPELYIQKYLQATREILKATSQKIKATLDKSNLKKLLQETPTTNTKETFDTIFTEYKKSLEEVRPVLKETISRLQTAREIYGEPDIMFSFYTNIPTNEKVKETRNITYDLADKINKASPGFMPENYEELEMLCNIDKFMIIFYERLSRYYELIEYLADDFNPDPLQTSTSELETLLNRGFIMRESNGSPELTYNFLVLSTLLAQAEQAKLTGY